MGTQSPVSLVRKQISFAVLSRGPYKNVHKRITRSHICDTFLFPKVRSS